MSIDYQKLEDQIIEFSKRVYEEKRKQLEEKVMEIKNKIYKRLEEFKTRLTYAMTSIR